MCLERAAMFRHKRPCVTAAFHARLNLCPVCFTCRITFTNDITKLNVRYHEAQRDGTTAPRR